MEHDALKKLNIGIISSRFNEEVVSELFEACIANLQVAGVNINNIKHEIYFSDNFQYQGNRMKLTHLEGVDYRFMNQDKLANRTYYSGYSNVEGFKNTTRSNNKKFAATAIAGGIIITGAVVATIALVVSAF